MSFFLSHSTGETEEFAAKWGAKLKPGSVILLAGPLGAGKTAFVRGFFTGLGGDPNYLVTSPTFTLQNIYPTKKGPLHHLDLYRLGNYREFREAGLEETLDGKGFAVIEWGDKFAELQSSCSSFIRIEIIGEKIRKIKISPPVDNLK
ncbi:MAG: tRNA (adenosine(37)-N6)-threonylcarbamoyltransferase complex ATPase subunit type 1 TsaE [Deltaproteobacteria bacterium]|nr:tRNA (adenosine(37)-N6)-threonylcarbamoyltransferase complex ATPase subunit type 1 TsaE [Deltaproteobacteria bacterium]